MSALAGISLRLVQLLSAQGRNDPVPVEVSHVEHVATANRTGARFVTSLPEVRSGCREGGRQGLPRRLERIIRAAFVRLIYRTLKLPGL